MSYTLNYRVLNARSLTPADRITLRLHSNLYSLNAAMMTGTIQMLGLDPETFKGSCTLPNEHIAALAFEALIGMARETNAIIGLCDEGGFLLLPVILQGGTARPWLEEIRARFSERDGDGLIVASDYGERQTLMKLLGRNGADPWAFTKRTPPAASLTPSPTVA